MLSEERRIAPRARSPSRRAAGSCNPDVRDEFGIETIDMNMGPQHPAMHGLLRLILELDGETVVRCDPVMGYLHRCQEKIAENRMYPAVIPLTDRLDYFANMHNEHGYVPCGRGPARRGDPAAGRVHPRPHVRAHAAREPHSLHRVPLLELGAFTPILYAFRERERIQTIFEAVTGARMMFHYIRIGGVKADLPPDIPEKIWDFLEGLEQRLPVGLRRPHRGERDLHLPHRGTSGR